jgi:hypothetical protein
MTKCDECKTEVGPLLCGKCRAHHKRSHALIPVLFYDQTRKGYRSGCSCIECPWNENGICVTVIPKIEFIRFHEFDGDNIVRQSCG